MLADDFVTALGQMRDCQTLLWASRRAGIRLGIFGEVLGDVIRRWGAFQPAETRLLSFVRPFSPITVTLDLADGFDAIADAIAACVPLADYHQWRARSVIELNRAEGEGFLDPIPANRLIAWFDGETGAISLTAVGAELEACLDDDLGLGFRAIQDRAIDDVGLARLALLSSYYSLETSDESQRAYESLAKTAAFRAREREDRVAWQSPGVQGRLIPIALGCLSSPAPSASLRNQLLMLSEGSEWLSRTLSTQSNWQRGGGVVLAQLSGGATAVACTPWSIPRIVQHSTTPETPDGSRTPWIRIPRNLKGADRMIGNALPFGAGAAVVVWRDESIGKFENGTDNSDQMVIMGRIGRDASPLFDLPPVFDYIPLPGYVEHGRAIVIRVDPAPVARAARLGQSLWCAAGRTPEAAERQRGQ